jgi:two-component system, NtrC family, response regulator AtoC
MEHHLLQPGLGSAAPGEDEFPIIPVFEPTSPSMRAVMSVLRELAHSPVPVLLIGEPGTGKESIARHIHHDSGGLDDCFQVKSCREITPEQLSGGVSQNSTVYLDEIGDLSNLCQKQLSELLARPAGNGGPRTAPRIVCGSSRDLEPDVRAGNFREDLYYRLSGVCLRIPPLRQRREDIPQLVEFFLERYAAAYRCSVPALSAATQQLFADYAWPGNIPQLEAAVRTIVAVGDEAVAMTGLRSMLTQPNGKSNGDKVSLKEASRAASREAEKELILKVLNRTRWNRRRAAQELQISYKALLYKLKQIGYGEYTTS